MMRWILLLPIMGYECLALALLIDVFQTLYVIPGLFGVEIFVISAYLYYKREKKITANKQKGHDGIWIAREEAEKELAKKKPL